MAIDLTNHESLRGAVDALKTILKSRKKPIEVQPSPDSAGEGPQLKLPKNSKIKPTKETEKQEQEKEKQQNTSKQPSVKDDSPQKEPQKNKVDPLDELDDKEETEEERQARINRINDPSEIEQDIEDIKQDKELRDGEILRAKKKALDDLTQAITGGDLRDFSSFSADLFKAISTQVKKAKHKEDTYRRPNASYAGTDYLLPGKDYLDKKSIPVVAVYFDQSGSWGDPEVKKGMQALASIAQFERQNRIKIKLYFFADHLHDSPERARWEGSTGGFGEVLKHINNPANKITNVIILSDRDIENQTRWEQQPVINVKGCVWFLWKGGSRSKTALKHLKGERGTFQYELPTV